MSALSAVLIIFSFQSSMSFSQSAQRLNWFTQYRTADVTKKLGKFFCTERKSQGNDFELILTVKIKTRHPLEGSLGSDFPAICNHCVFMAA